MRAMLSTGAAHAEDGSRYTPGVNVWEAEREALALLAVAEPQTIDTGHDMPYWSGRAALAEALAGFIGEA